MIKEKALGEVVRQGTAELAVELRGTLARHAITLDDATLTSYADVLSRGERVLLEVGS